MSIEQLELLVDQATSSLGNNQILIKDRLIFLAKQSNWFKQSLQYVLEKGMKLAVEDTWSGGFFDGIENKLSIRSDLLNSTIPKQILLEKLSITFRHEVTHAVDWADLTFQAKKNHKLLTDRLNRNLLLGNLLFNKLNCIYVTKSVNPEFLNTLSKLITKVRTVNNYLVVGVDTGELVNEIIMNLGSCFNPQIKEDPFNVFYIKSYQVSNKTTIFEQTSDLVQVQKYFNLTANVRHQNNKTHFEALFYNSFDSERVGLWASLTLKQRMALNTLFQIRRGILKHVSEDNICYPEFVNCVSALENDCLLDLLSCQTGGHQQVSFFETNAILQEGFDSNLIDIKNFEGICTGDDLYYFKTSKERNIALTSISNCFIFSFISSLVDELSVSFLTSYEVGYPVLCRTILNVYLALILALINLTYDDENNFSLFWTLMVPITLTLLKCFIERPISNQQSTFLNNAARYSLNSLSIASVVVSNNKWEALGSVCSGVLGSVGGSFLGKSMSKWLKLSRPQETQVHAKNEILEFKKMN